MTHSSNKSDAGGTPRALDKIARTLALVGGFAVVGVALLTLASVIGRYAFSKPITGDYELVEYGISFAVFCFLGFTHLTDGHLIAEFFSSRMSKRKLELIDVFQNIILLAILLVLIWRVALGGIDKFETSEESMLLQMKVWWLHLIGVIGLLIFAWASFTKIISGLRK
jgi:TRAP-type C4-dicarboxylate transport system permease small subunit